MPASNPVNAMDAFYFGKRSRENLNECHFDLVRLAERALALSPYDFGIIDGGRYLYEQKDFLAAGKSRTLKSRHRWAWPLTPGGNRSRKFSEPVSHALDFMIYLHGRATWEEQPYRRVHAEAWVPASKELGIPIRWGGHFRGIFDGPHIQLSWKDYPAEYATELG